MRDGNEVDAHRHDTAQRHLIRHDTLALRYVPHVQCDGVDVFRAACALDLEGIVSKPADSPYVSAPSPWRKTLNPAYTQKSEARFDLFRT